jgi:hypothetical protein
MVYDAAAHTLRWAEGRVNAELVLGSPDGAALYKVTGSQR